MKVIKRDGTPQEYDFMKIANAVTKAFQSVEQQVPDKFLEQVKESVEKVVISNNGDGTPIEEIQDTIQKELIKRNKYEVVEAFINYRRKREEIREQNSDVMKQIKIKLAATDVQNQNANMDEASFTGRLGEASSVAAKDVALKHMSKIGRKNHEDNFVYIHDLDHFEIGDHNCLSIMYDTLLANGFKTRQTDVRPASSVNTAFQLMAVIFQLQSLQQFGGVSSTHIDWTMVPYVRLSFLKHFKDGLKYIEEYDEKTRDEIINEIIGCENNTNEYEFKESVKKISVFDEKYKSHEHSWQYAIDLVERETHQAVEGFYHNLNTLQSRSGGQLPFTSINYGTCTLPEGRMVTQELLKVCMEGLGRNGVTSIFPCGIFQYKKGINDKPGTPNYDLKRMALESTTKRIYPNYANCDWSNQVNWFKMDRKMKQDYIDSLDVLTYNTLFCKIADNPKVCLEKVGLYNDLDDGATVKVDMTEKPIEYFSTMGCRTVNGLDVNAFDNFKANVQHIINGEFDKIDDIFSGVQKDGRGNICPTTIIMPTIAATVMKKLNKKFENSDLTDEAKQEMIFREFMNLLDKKIHEAKDMLLERFNHICSQSPKSAKFMYDNHAMAGYHEDEGIISALKHGTLVIGQLGMSETLYILFGFDQTTNKGMEYAKQIEKMFNVRCGEFKQEYKLNFGVYYTPAESLCGTALRKFKKDFPEFDLEHVTYYIDNEGNRVEKEWFTNSIHVPVEYECDPFQKIDIESQLVSLSNAGCITYVEVGEVPYNNIDAIEKLVDYAMEHDIPYFAINLKISQCHECGERIWDLDMKKCPKCGCEKIDQLGRVTGYLSTTVEHFNKAKQAEFKNRTNHFKN